MLNGLRQFKKKNDDISSRWVHHQTDHNNIPYKNGSSLYNNDPSSTASICADHLYDIDCAGDTTLLTGASSRSSNGGRHHSYHHHLYCANGAGCAGSGATGCAGAAMSAWRRALPRTSLRRACLALALLAAAGVALMYKVGMLCADERTDAAQMITNEKYVVGADKQVYMYNRQMPLIFIGGVPRSGTTLMRAMLDAHPDVRCGQETRVIPRILQMRSHWMKSEKESVRLAEAGITKNVLDAAIASFCLEIIARHGDPAPRLCNKDPLTIKMGTYVLDLFPNAKFLFMIRDGRATAHSIISRKVTITGFDLTSYRQCLTKWNQAVEVMNTQCQALGSDRCMRVPYEQLVLHPQEWMRKILNFLDVPWDDSVLHHDQFINKGVSLSKVERSSDQVIKPVNLEALTKWVGHIPDDVVRDMADIAPMLSVLGYDPYANPPEYGKPDSQVADNTRYIKNNQRLFEEKARQLLKPSNHFEETMMEEIVSEAPDNA